MGRWSDVPQSFLQVNFCNRQRAAALSEGHRAAGGIGRIPLSLLWEPENATNWRKLSERWGARQEGSSPTAWVPALRLQVGWMEQEVSYTKTAGELLLESSLYLVIVVYLYSYIPSYWFLSIVSIAALQKLFFTTLWLSYLPYVLAYRHLHFPWFSSWVSWGCSSKSRVYPHHVYLVKDFIGRDETGKKQKFLLGRWRIL